MHKTVVYAVQFSPKRALLDSMSGVSINDETLSACQIYKHDTQRLAITIPLEPASLPEFATGLKVRKITLCRICVLLKLHGSHDISRSKFVQCTQYTCQNNSFKCNYTENTLLFQPFTTQPNVFIKIEMIFR